MTIDLTKILMAIIDLLAALIAYRMIPWLKANTTEKQQKIMGLAYDTAVFAAEQLYGSGHGSEKLDYAVEWIKSKGFDADRAEIEARVKKYFSNYGKALENTEE